jgi:CBS domain containing-hemolysin-like protein
VRSGRVDGSFLVKGSVEIEELEEILGVDFGNCEASTVSGLVVNSLGRVPSSGGSVLLSGTKIDILNSDQERIGLMRARPLEVVSEDPNLQDK